MRLILLKSKIHRCTVRVQSRSVGEACQSATGLPYSPRAAHGDLLGGNPPSRLEFATRIRRPPAFALTPLRGAPGVRFPSR